MRGRSIKTQQIPIQSPGRALSPVIQIKPQDNNLNNLKCEKVIMGLEIQRLNSILIDMERKKQLIKSQYQQREQILLLEIQSQREITQELQNKENEFRDRLQIQLQQVSKQEKEVREHKELVKTLQYENQLLEQKVSYLLTLSQQQQPQSQQQSQQLSQQPDQSPKKKQTGHFLDQSGEQLSINHQISQLKNNLLNFKSKNVIQSKYSSLAEMQIELIQSHLNAVNQLPDIREVETQQIQVYLTTMLKDLESLKKYETPVAVRRILNNQSPIGNKSLSPSLSSDEVFMKIISHIEHLQSNCYNIPTIIKQISLLNQLVRLKNEDLKIQGHKKTVVGYSPQKFSTGQKLTNSLRILTPVRQISPIRISPVRISPVRISPTTRVGISTFNIPQRVSIYPQRVLFESSHHPQQYQHSYHMNQNRLSQPRQRTEGPRAEESQTMEQQQGSDVFYRQQSIYIKDLELQLKNAQNSVQFESNRVQQLTDELIRRNEEVSQLKRLVDAKIDDQVIKQELNLMKQQIEILTQQNQSLSNQNQQMKNKQQDQFQEQLSKIEINKDLQQQEIIIAVKRSESQYVNEITEVKRQLSYYQQSYESLKELIDKKEIQIQQLVIQLAQIQQENPHIQVDIPQQPEQSEEQDQQMQLLKKQITEQNKIIQQLNHKIQSKSKQEEPQEQSNLQTENITQLLHQQAQNYENQMSNQTQQYSFQIQQLRDQLNALQGPSDQTILELQQKIQELSHQLEAKNQQFVLLAQQDEHNDQQLKQFKLEAHNLQVDNQTLKSKISELEKVHPIEQAQHQATQEQINQACQTATQQLQANLQNLQQTHAIEIANYQNQVKEAEKMQKDSQSQTTKIMKELHQTQQELIQVHAQVPQGSAVIAPAPIQFSQDPEKILLINQLEAKIQLLQNQIVELEKQMKHNEEAFKQALGPEKHAQDPTLKLVQSNQELSTQNLALQTQSQEVQTELLKSQNDVAKLNRTLIEMQKGTQTQVLEKELQNKEIETQTLTKQVDHWKLKYQQTLEQFSQQTSPTSVQQQLLKQTQIVHEQEEQIHIQSVKIDQMIPSLEAKISQQEQLIIHANQEQSFWQKKYEDYIKQRDQEQPVSEDGKFWKQKYEELSTQQQKPIQSQEQSDQLKTVQLNLETQQNNCKILEEQLEYSQQQIKEIQQKYDKVYKELTEAKGVDAELVGFWKNKFDEQVRMSQGQNAEEIVNQAEIEATTRKAQSQQAIGVSEQSQTEPSKQVQELQKEIVRQDGQLKQLEYQNKMLLSEKSEFEQNQTQLMSQINELYLEIQKKQVLGEEQGLSSPITFSQDPQNQIIINQLQEQIQKLNKRIEELQNEKNTHLTELKEMIGSGKSEEALLQMLQKNQELDMELSMKVKENQNLAQNNINFQQQVIQYNLLISELQGRLKKDNVEQIQKLSAQLQEANTLMESWKNKYLAVFKDYTDVSKTYENQKQLDDEKIQAQETQIAQIKETLTLGQEEIVNKQLLMQQLLNDSIKEKEFWNQKYEELQQSRQEAFKQIEIEQKDISESIPLPQEPSTTEGDLRLQLEDQLRKFKLQEQSLQLIKLENQTLATENQRLREQQIVYQEKLSYQVIEDFWKQKYTQLIESVNPTQAQTIIQQQEQQIANLDVPKQIDSPIKKQVDQSQLIELNSQISQQDIQMKQLNQDKIKLLDDLQLLQKELNNTLAKVVQSQQPQSDPIQFSSDPEKILRIQQLEQLNIQLSNQIEQVEVSRVDDQKRFQQIIGSGATQDQIVKLIEENQNYQTQVRELTTKLSLSQHEVVHIQSQITKLNKQMIQINEESLTQESKQIIQQSQNETELAQKQVDHWKAKYQEVLEKFSKQISPTNIQNQLIQATQTIHELEEQVHSKQIIIDQQIPPQIQKISELTQQFKQSSDEAIMWHERYEDLVKQRQEQVQILTAQQQKELVDAQQQSQFWKQKHDELVEHHTQDLSPSSVQAKLVQQMDRANQLEAKNLQLQQQDTVAIQQLNNQIAEYVQTQSELEKSSSALTESKRILEIQIKSQQESISQFNNNETLLRKRILELENVDSQAKEQFWKQKYTELVEQVHPEQAAQIIEKHEEQAPKQPEGTQTEAKQNIQETDQKAMDMMEQMKQQMDLQQTQLNDKIKHLNNERNQAIEAQRNAQKELNDYLNKLTQIQKETVAGDTQPKQMIQYSQDPQQVLKISQLEQLNITLQGQIKTIQEQRQKDQEIWQQTVQTGSQEEQIINLMKNNQDIQSQTVDLQHKLDTSNMEIIHLQSQQTKLNKQILSLQEQTQAQDLQKELQILLNENSQQIEQITHWKEKYQEVLDKFSKQISPTNVQHQLVALTKQVHDLEEVNKIKEQMIDAEMPQLKSSIINLQEKLKQQTDDSNMWQGRYEDLIQNRSQQVQTLSIEQQQLIVDSQTQMDFWKNKYEELHSLQMESADQDKIKSELLKSISKVNELESENIKITKQLSNGEIQLKNTVTELEIIQQEQSTEILQLKQQILNLENRCAQLNEQNQQLLADLQLARQDLLQIQNQQVAIKEDFWKAKYEKLIEELKGQLPPTKEQSDIQQLQQDKPKDEALGDIASIYVKQIEILRQQIQDLQLVQKDNENLRLEKSKLVEIQIELNNQLNQQQAPVVISQVQQDQSKNIRINQLEQINVLLQKQIEETDSLRKEDSQKLQEIISKGANSEQVIELVNENQTLQIAKRDYQLKLEIQQQETISLQTQIKQLYATISSQSQTDVQEREVNQYSLQNVELQNSIDHWKAKYQEVLEKFSKQISPTNVQNQLIQATQTIHELEEQVHSKQIIIDQQIPPQIQKISELTQQFKQSSDEAIMWHERYEDLVKQRQEQVQILTAQQQKELVDAQQQSQFWKQKHDELVEHHTQDLSPSSVQAKLVQQMDRANQLEAKNLQLQQQDTVAIQQLNNQIAEYVQTQSELEKSSSALTESKRILEIQIKSQQESISQFNNNETLLRKRILELENVDSQAKEQFWKQKFTELVEQVHPQQAAQIIQKHEEQAQLPQQQLEETQTLQQSEQFQSKQPNELLNVNQYLKEQVSQQNTKIEELTKEKETSLNRIKTLQLELNESMSQLIKLQQSMKGAESQPQIEFQQDPEKVLRISQLEQQTINLTTQIEQLKQLRSEDSLKFTQIIGEGANQEQIVKLVQESQTLQNKNMELATKIDQVQHDNLQLASQITKLNKQMIQINEESQTQESKQIIQQSQNETELAQKQVDHWKAKYQEVLEKFSKQISPTNVQNQLIQATQTIHELEEQVHSKQIIIDQQIPPQILKISELTQQFKQSSDEAIMWHERYEDLVKQRQEQVQILTAQQQKELVDAQQQSQFWKQKHDELVEHHTQDLSPSSVQAKLVQQMDKANQLEAKNLQLQQQDTVAIQQLNNQIAEQVQTQSELEKSSSALTESKRILEIQIKSQQESISQFNNNETLLRKRILELENVDSQAKEQFWKQKYTELVEQVHPEQAAQIIEKHEEQAQKPQQLYEGTQTILQSEEVQQENELLNVNQYLKEQVSQQNTKIEELTKEKETSLNRIKTLQLELNESMSQLIKLQQSMKGAESQPQIEFQQDPEKVLRISQLEQQTINLTTQIEQLKQLRSEDSLKFTQIIGEGANQEQIVKLVQESQTLQNKNMELATKIDQVQHDNLQLASQITKLNKQMIQINEESQTQESKQIIQQSQNETELAQKQVDHWKAKYQEVLEKFSKQISPTNVQNQLIQATQTIHELEEQVHSKQIIIDQQIPPQILKISELTQQFKQSSDEAIMWHERYEDLVKQRQEQVQILTAQQQKELVDAQQQSQFWKQKHDELVEHHTQDLSPSSVQAKLVQQMDKANQLEAKNLQLQQQDTVAIQQLNNQIAEQVQTQSELEKSSSALTESKRILEIQIKSQQESISQFNNNETLLRKRILELENVDSQAKEQFWKQKYTELVEQVHPEQAAQIIEKHEEQAQKPQQLPEGTQTILQQQEQKIEQVQSTDMQQQLNQYKDLINNLQLEKQKALDNQIKTQTELNNALTKISQLTSKDDQQTLQVAEGQLISELKLRLNQLEILNKKLEVEIQKVEELRQIDQQKFKDILGSGANEEQIIALIQQQQEHQIETRNLNKQIELSQQEVLSLQLTITNLNKEIIKIQESSDKLLNQDQTLIDQLKDQMRENSQINKSEQIQKLNELTINNEILRQQIKQQNKDQEALNEIQQFWKQKYSDLLKEVKPQEAAQIIEQHEQLLPQQPDGTQTEEIQQDDSQLIAQLKLIQNELHLAQQKIIQYQSLEQQSEQQSKPLSQLQQVGQDQQITLRMHQLEQINISLSKQIEQEQLQRKEDQNKFKEILGTGPNQEQIVKLIAEKSTIQNQYTEMKVQLEASNLEVISIQSRIIKLNEQSIQFNESGDQISKLNHDLEISQQQVEHWKLKYQEVLDKFSKQLSPTNIQNQLIQTTKTIHELEENAKSMQLTIVKLTEQSVTQANQIQEKQTEATQWHDRFEQQLKVKQDEVQVLAVQHQAQAAEAQQQMNFWKQKYDEHVENQLQSKSPTGVQTKLTLQLQQIHQLEAQVLSIQKISQEKDISVQTQTQQLQTHLQNLQQTHATEIANYQNQVKEAEKMQKDSQSQTTKIMKELHQTQQELIQVHAQVPQGSAVIAPAPIQFSQDPEKILLINQLEAKIQLLQNQIVELEKQMKHNEEAFKQALGPEKHAQDPTLKLVQSNQELSTQNLALQTQSQEVQTELLKSQNDVAKLNRTLIEMQKGTQTQVLEKELQNKEIETQTLTKQVDHWKLKYQQTLEQFSQQTSPTSVQQQLLKQTQIVHEQEEQIHIQSVKIDQMIPSLEAKISQQEQLIIHANQEQSFWQKKYEDSHSQIQIEPQPVDQQEDKNQLMNEINHWKQQYDELLRFSKEEHSQNELATRVLQQQELIGALINESSNKQDIQGRSSSTQPGDSNLQQLIESTRRNQQLELELEKRDQLINQLKDRIIELQGELNQIKNQEDTIKSDFWKQKYQESVSGENDNEIQKLANQNLELLKEINDLKINGDKLKQQVDDLGRLNDNIMNQMRQALSGGVNEKKISDLIEKNHEILVNNNELNNQLIIRDKKITEQQEIIFELQAKIQDLQDPSVAEQTQMRVSDIDRQLELVGEQVNFWKDKYQQVLDDFSKNLSPTNLQQKLVQQTQDIHNLEEALTLLQKSLDQEKSSNEQILEQLQLQIKYQQEEINSLRKRLLEREQLESTIPEETHNQIVQFWKNKYQELLQFQQKDQTKAKEILAHNEELAESLLPEKTSQIVLSQDINREQFERLRNENQKLTQDITFYQSKIIALEQISKNITQDDGSQQDTILSQQQQIGQLEQKLKLQQEEAQYWVKKYREIAQQNISREMGPVQSEQNLQNSASYWRQKYDEAIRMFEQEKLELQQQLGEKDDQLEQHMQSFQSILKDELKEELTKLRQQELLDRQQFEQKVHEQYQSQLDANTIQKLQQAHEREKEQLIKEFLLRIDQLIASNVQKYPEGENWKELILKYEKQRQNELYELRQQLEILQRSYISTHDVEFYAERRAYENTINELKSRIIQEDPQDLYDTIEYQRNQILDLQDQVQYLQNERTQLEMHILQQNQTIEGLKDNLSRFQQQSDQRRKQRVEVLDAIDNMRRDRERDRDSYRSPFRPTRYSHKGSWERDRQPKEYLRQSNQQQFSSPIQMMQSQSENKEIVSKLQELDEVKHKYQTALNNILRLESQVIEKLQQDDILIE